MPDIKTVWPKAEVIPILVGQKVDSKNLETLLSDLKNNCGFDCLLIFSVDFSHYLPATLAEVHDAYTLNQLQNLNTNKILEVEVDSPQSLYLMTGFAVSRNTPKWSLFAHTNSGFIAHDPDSETTTHIFGSYSRSYSYFLNLKSYVSFYTSVTTPQKLNRSQNQTTIGDRFFYGVDSLTVDPSNNFVVSTITTPTKIIKSFLPIKGNLFVRGSDKSQLIKQYFDSIPNEPNLTKDYFWGKLIYERNTSSSGRTNY